MNGFVRAVAGLVASLGCACAPVMTSPPPLGDVPPASLDSLSAHPALSSEYHQRLRAARWHLLRALDERRRSHFEEAQRDLDLAFRISEYFSLPVELVFSTRPQRPLSQELLERQRETER